jgi:hypothetical protein
MNNEIIELFVDVTKTYLSTDIVETENNSERLDHPVGRELARIVWITAR